MHSERSVRPRSGLIVSTTRPSAGRHGAGFCRSHLVGRPGLEPGTYGLKVRKSGAQSALPALIGTRGRSERPECTERSGRCFHDSFHASLDPDVSLATECNRRASQGLVPWLPGAPRLGRRGERWNPAPKPERPGEDFITQQAWTKQCLTSRPAHRQTYPAIACYHVAS